MEWSNDVVLEFLDLYKQEPMIWCPSHRDYRNRKSVNDAWKKIARNLNLNCPVNELKKKKDSLMATFRPLVNKVTAMTYMDGDGGVYKPSWFAYEKMESFLLGVYKPRLVHNVEDLEDFTVFGDESIQGMKDITCDSEQLDTDSPDHADMRTEVKEEPNDAISRESLEVSNVEENNRKRCAESKTDGTTKIPRKSSKNEMGPTNQCSLYGQLVAHKLETLDEVARAIVMHEIDNILFRAVMNRLNPGFMWDSSCNSKRFSPENCDSHNLPRHIYPAQSTSQVQSNINSSQTPSPTSSLN